MVEFSFPDNKNESLLITKEGGEVEFRFTYLNLHSENKIDTILMTILFSGLQDNNLLINHYSLMNKSHSHDGRLGITSSLCEYEIRKITSMLNACKDNKKFPKQCLQLFKQCLGPLSFKIIPLNKKGVSVDRFIVMGKGYRDFISTTLDDSVLFELIKKFLDSIKNESIFEIILNNDVNIYKELSLEMIRCDSDLEIIIRYEKDRTFKIVFYKVSLFLNSREESGPFIYTKPGINEKLIAYEIEINKDETDPTKREVKFLNSFSK